jgi:hypothetical protein
MQLQSAQNGSFLDVTVHTFCRKQFQSSAATTDITVAGDSCHKHAKIRVLSYSINLDPSASIQKHTLHNNHIQFMHWDQYSAFSHVWKK